MAGRLGHAGLRLDQFGDAAFVHAMHVTTAISAVITLAGALVVLIWMPGRRPAAQAGLAGSEVAGSEVASAEVASAEAREAAGIPAGVAAEAVVEN